MPGQWVYLENAFQKTKAARISPFDRSFLFAHSAYEVTAVYNAKLIDFDAHLARLHSTLEALEIPFPQASLELLHTELMARNRLTEGLIYLQVSAGDYAGRDFYGPETLSPLIFIFTQDKSLINDTAKNGISAISVEDTRWARRDIKTTQLLSQSLAYRKARRAGATTAFMHENGVITEAASANAWIVDTHGTLITRALSPAILPGITRQRVLALLENERLMLEERSFTVKEAKTADEAFTSSAGAMIAPVLKLDDTVIGNGQPGPITRVVQRAYYEHIGADVASVAPWTLV